MKLDNNQQAFFELVQAGLWEKEARLSQFGNIDYAAILQIAEDQCVVGLVTAGLEKVKDVNVPKEQLLQFVGSTLQIEQQNKSVNVFVAWVIELLRKKDVYTLLVKGQGIAQCYTRPLWRASGDVDLLLSNENYEKAKHVLIPRATKVECEFKSLKHLALTMEEGYVVELHGMFHSRLSKRVDRMIDEVQRDVFYSGNVRSWQNGGTTVFLPSPDNDVIFVFTHILKHFYIEGVGLRQICDWCRLLWKYRSVINVTLLEERLRKAGLMSEWRGFAAFAVYWLGMPEEAMPFFDSRLRSKGDRIMEFVLETGNFGHNRKINRSNIWIIGKLQAAWFKMHDFARHARLFPLDSVKFFIHYALNGISVTRDRLNDKNV